ncbi:MAG: hypothetical protein LBO08_02520 [Rickettsiales bacterium]|jgi:hypothetical protein|nr:hypothetical protein [Rickettsiales bacterium]
MRKLIPLILLLTACNFVSLKPGTVDKTQTFLAQPGGFNMRNEAKGIMEKRGYAVIVGKQRGGREIDLSGEELDSLEMNITDIMNARYIVRIREKSETFMPVWCFFNGMQWWHFSVSVSDNKTGEEVLSWTGRGCRNSSLRRLDRYLDRLEMSD